ncbi:UNKNOWN [Stylonychia lemnae]|uniref:Uncharacterized protein n=1 Tax=Stylonychia lemnae TaxID=5949 RepID=A0A078AAG5_STYLE|nr:UNKNOWN [Stylonychia lemnae]|eukprot:CDW79260.1 UNKNOWN [Stylonychia lemnae]
MPSFRSQKTNAFRNTLNKTLLLPLTMRANQDDSFQMEKIIKKAKFSKRILPNGTEINCIRAVTKLLDRILVERPNVKNFCKILDTMSIQNRDDGFQQIIKHDGTTIKEVGDVSQTCKSLILVKDGQEYRQFFTMLEEITNELQLQTIDSQQKLENQQSQTAFTPLDITYSSGDRAFNTKQQDLFLFPEINETQRDQDQKIQHKNEKALQGFYDQSRNAFDQSILSVDYKKTMNFKSSRVRKVENSQIPNLIKINAIYKNELQMSPKVEANSNYDYHSNTRSRYQLKLSPHSVNRKEFSMNITTPIHEETNPVSVQDSLMLTFSKLKQSRDLIQLSNSEKVRLKFKKLQREYLSLPDFKYENFTLNKLIELKINLHQEFLAKYELTLEEEASFIEKLYKQLIYKSIKAKYGYIKKFVSEIGVSIEVLCQEFKIGSQILTYFDINQVNSKIKPLIYWNDFVKFYGILILRKPLITDRLDYIIRLFQIREISQLQRQKYIIERFKEINHNQDYVVKNDLMAFWDKFRLLICNYLNENSILLEEIIMQKLIENLQKFIQYQETFVVFDSLFEFI